VSDEGTLRRLVAEFGSGGLDYVVDDELTVGTSILPFTSRVRAMVQEVKRVEDKLGKRLPYIANITATYLNALQFAWEAKELGAAGVMVNTVAMGYDAVAHLATNKDFGLGIFANSIGRGVLTSGPGYRIAPAFLCKLARLAGADGVYTGPLVGSIDNVRQYSASYRCSLTEPFHHGCRRRQSAAVMSGGISLPELLNNEVLYDGPLYLSLGRGLVNPIVEGISGSVVLDCIRTLWDALVEGNVKEAKLLSKRLAKKGPAYVKCLGLIRADEALDTAPKG
jgi:ribulose 1,5-bisphosphate carboxylase large subunit-like protein